MDMECHIRTMPAGGWADKWWLSLDESWLSSHEEQHLLIICVQAPMCRGWHVGLCANRGRRSASSVIPFLRYCPLYWFVCLETRSYWNLPSSPSWLGSDPQRSCCLCLPILGLLVSAIASIWCRFWASNSGLCTWKASISLSCLLNLTQYLEQLCCKHYTMSYPMKSGEYNGQQAGTSQTPRHRPDVTGLLGWQGHWENTGQSHFIMNLQGFESDWTWEKLSDRSMLSTSCF